MDSFSASLVNYFISHDYIDSSKKNVYQYGVLVAIQSLISFIASITVGIVLGMFFENLCFFITFKLSRKYSGGLHSNKYTSCLTISILLNVASLGIIKALERSTYYPLIIGLEILALIFVILLSPVENMNKKINKKELIWHKVFATIICGFLIICSIVLALHKICLIFPIGMGVFLNGILVVVGKIKNIINKNSVE